MQVQKLFIFACLTLVRGQTCPSDWTDVGNYCYGTTGTAGTFQESNLACKSVNGNAQLTTIQNHIEAAVVLSNCAYTNMVYEYWISSGSNFILSPQSSNYWSNGIPTSVTGVCVNVDSGVLTTGGCNRYLFGCCRILKSAYASRTPTVTPSSSITPSRTRTPSHTATSTISPTMSSSTSLSSSASPSVSVSPSLSPSALPNIIADSQYDILSQGLAWSWGYFQGFDRNEFTEYGKNQINGRVGWYLPGYYAFVGSNSLSPNAAEECITPNEDDISISLKWTNNYNLQFTNVTVLFEFDHNSFCGDGVSIIFMIDNQIYEMNNVGNDHSFSEYYVLNTIDELELVVNGGLSCQCDLSTYRIRVYPSYDGKITPQPLPNFDDDDWYGEWIDEASPSASPSSSESPSPSMSISITPSITPTPSRTPSITPTNTPTSSQTPSVSLTPSSTPSITQSETATSSQTPSISPTPSESATPSVSATPSLSTSVSSSSSPSPSISPSPSQIGIYPYSVSIDNLTNLTVTMNGANEVVYLQKVIADSNFTFKIPGVMISMATEPEDRIYEVILRNRESQIISNVLSIRQMSVSWLPRQPTSVFQFYLFQYKYAKVVICVSRTIFLESWSAVGCEFKEGVCECSHFTEFALQSLDSDGSDGAEEAEEGAEGSEEIIGEFWNTPFLAVILTFVLGLLTVCFTANALDGVAKENLIRQMRKTEYMQRVNAFTEGDLFHSNSGCCSAWKCTKSPLRLKFGLGPLLFNHRFMNWFFEYIIDYDRFYRLIVLGGSILTTGYFSGLIYKSPADKGFGFLTGFITSMLYIPVTMFFEMIWKRVGIWEFQWKLPGVYKELKRCKEFEVLLTPTFVKHTLDSARKFRIEDSKNFAFIEKHLKPAPAKAFREKSIVADGNIQSHATAWLPFRNIYSLLTVAGFGSWIAWCAFYFVKFVFYHSWDKVTFVVRSTGWSYLFVFFAIEPILSAINSALTKKKFHKQITVDNTDDHFKNQMDSFVKNSSIYNPVQKMLVITDLLTAKKMLYMLHLQVKKIEKEGNGPLRVQDGPHILNISDVDLEITYD